MNTFQDDDAARLSTRTFEAMGTVISISAPIDSSEVAVATETAARVFMDAEERFSPFLSSSELSRVNRGEILLPDASATFREVYALASEFSYLTHGHFSPYSPSGDLDLNGVVKAWTIREAGNVLDTVGIPHWSINAGGDILVSGSPAPSHPSAHDPRARTPFFGTPWALGIVDPHDSSQLLATIDATGTPGFQTALATSGIAERGHHIWSRADSHPGPLTRPDLRNRSASIPAGPDQSLDDTQTDTPAPIIQVSVMGPDIVTADALATSLAAGGSTSFSMLSQFPGYEALAVLSDGSLVASNNWPRTTRHRERFEQSVMY
ncbi:FAD:protein FMN transferase [Neomicrococcus lactis]